MTKLIFLLLMVIPGLTLGQSTLAKRYADDRINADTYLYFKADSTFAFEYVCDLMGDHATGKYHLKKDTLFLSFDKPVDGSINQFLASNVRADSLIIKGHKLFKIKDRRWRIDTPISGKFVSEIKKQPQENKYFRKLIRRKYWIFGPWHLRICSYYMIDERYAKWATVKWLKEHKELFQ